jgi:2-polyprenyl-3-methyl-5-hydroxy-6-metoxy-1,4-benzoquinol methylase
MRNNHLDGNCPSCEADQIDHIGSIPASNYFAGSKLHKSIYGGDLYRCKKCYLYFRFPKMSRFDLEKSYMQPESDGRWEKTFNERLDWKIAAKWIKAENKELKILDVGCNDGTFLVELSSKHSRYGIELNPAAASRAKEQGVEIIGSEFETSISELNIKFDTVTAFDVIEHVDDPFHFMSLLEKKLSSGGEIIISTGNTESWSWKLMGSKYWYCVPPEHITFINMKWAKITAKKLGLTVIENVSFAHLEGSTVRRFINTAKNIIFKIIPIAFVWRRNSRFSDNILNTNKEINNLAPPGWNTARDHFIIRFRK